MKRPILWLLGITLCIYAQVLSFDFVNLDDPSHLDNNPYYSPLTPRGYLEFWKRPHFLYMPLTYSVWSLGVWASGDPKSALSHTPRSKTFRFSASLFHFFTLLFHLITVCFVFYSLSLFSPSPWICLSGALFFALHPIQAESVAWVSALKDTLCGAFFFSAFYFYFKPNGYYLSLLLYMGALGSKPAAVVLSPLLLLISCFHFRRPIATEIRKLMPYIAITIPILWMTAKAQATETLHFQAPKLLEKCLVALDALGFYFVKLIWPFNMAVDYGRTPGSVLQNSITLFTSTAVLTALACLLYFLKRRSRKFEMLGIFVILLCILPVLGFKPFSFQTTSSVSDRFMYFALFGVALALLPTLHWLHGTQRRASLLISMLLLLASRTVDQTGYWRNTVSLFEHTIEINPKSWLAYNNLGSYYERLGLPEKALSHYRKAASIDRQGIFYNNIGSVCLMTRDFPCAIEAYREALSINPLSSIDHNGLGFSFLAMGKKQEARKAFEQALKLNPALSQSRYGLQLASKY